MSECLIKDRFINFKKFSTDLITHVGNNLESQTFVVDIPLKDSVTIKASSIDDLVIKLVKLSKCLPHNSCFMTYTFKTNLSINLTICPVTDAA